MWTLFIVMLALNLTEVTDISYWLVFMPLYLPYLALAVMMILAFIWEVIFGD